jgi:RNA 3'-terminal phosphate cyclase (ATP)
MRLRKGRLKLLKRSLKGYGDVEVIVDELKSHSKNTTIAITGVFENTVCCYTNLGERGKRAEIVAEETCEKFIRFISSGAVIDEHMADQILLPLSIADGVSEFTTPRITNHLLTNIETIKKFLEVDFEIEELGNSFKVKIKPGDKHEG